MSITEVAFSESPLLSTVNQSNLKRFQKSLVGWKKAGFQMPLLACLHDQNKSR